MNTKLVDKIYVEKNDIVDPLLKDWRDFLEGKPIVNETINNVYQKVCSLLVKRWVPMQDDLIYDNEIVACYKNPNKIPNYNPEFFFDHRFNDTDSEDEAFVVQYVWR